MTLYIILQRGHAGAHISFVPWQRGHVQTESGTAAARHHESQYLSPGSQFLCGWNGQADDLWGDPPDTSPEPLSKQEEVGICQRACYSSQEERKAKPGNAEMELIEGIRSILWLTVQTKSIFLKALQN